MKGSKLLAKNVLVETDALTSNCTNLHLFSKDIHINSKVTSHFPKIKEEAFLKPPIYFSLCHLEHGSRLSRILHGDIS